MEFTMLDDMGLVEGLTLDEWARLSDEEQKKAKAFKNDMEISYHTLLPSNLSYQTVSFLPLEDWELKDHAMEATIHDNRMNAEYFPEWAASVHRYIRKNGKPAHYPKSPAMIFSRSAGNETISCPVYLPAWKFEFHDSWDTIKEGNYWMCDGKRVLKPTLQKPGQYVPQYNAKYDPEFEELSGQLSKMKSRYSGLNSKLGQNKSRKELDELKKKAETSIIGQFIGGLFMAPVEAFLSLAILGVPYLACYFLIRQYGSDIAWLQNLPKWAICAPVVLLFLYRCWKKDIFEVRKHREAQKVYEAKAQEFMEQSKAMEPLRKEAEALGLEIQKLQSSPAYKEAERRNKVLYDADCKLAQEWQKEWYDEMVAAKLPTILYR